MTSKHSLCFAIYPMLLKHEVIQKLPAQDWVDAQFYEQNNNQSSLKALDSSRINYYIVKTNTACYLFWVNRIRFYLVCIIPNTGGF